MRRHPAVSIFHFLTFSPSHFLTSCLLHACIWTAAGWNVAHAAEPEVLKRWEFHTPQDADGWGGLHDAKDLHVENDSLHLSMTGVDTFLSAPAVDVPLDGIMVRVRLRSDRAGDTELFWRTSEMLNFEQSTSQRERTASTPAGQFQTVEFHIGKPQDVGKTLAQIRLDPFNNNQDGMVEIQSVEILRLSPVLDVRFSFDKDHVDVGEKVNELVTVRQLDGRAVRESMRAQIVGGFGTRMRWVGPATQPAFVGEDHFDTAGVHTLQAILQPQAAHADARMLTVIVGGGDRLPLLPVLRTEKTRLDLIRNAGSPERFSAARWQIRAESGEWTEIALLLPLCQMLTSSLGSGGAQEFGSGELLDHDSNHASLRFEFSDGAIAQVEFRLVHSHEREGLEVRSDLMLREGLDARAEWPVALFSGPSVRVNSAPGRDPLDRHAILGGVEFLEPGWRSSDERGLGKWFADRWSLAPHKIAMPVMAVEAGGITTAMMWDPQQEWVAGESMPVATFASPNFLDGQDNHLMELSVPGTTPYRRENASYAQKPYLLKKGQSIKLKYLLYAEADLPVALVSKRYYELMAPPPLPPPVHSDRDTYNLIAQNYGQTMYTAGKGFTMHWFMGEPPHPIPMMAAELVAHSTETGEKKWVDATGQAGRGIIEAAGSLVGQLGMQASAQASLNAMRPDGTFTFHNSNKMRQQARELTKGVYDSLGQDGSTSLGTCVQSALPLLRYTELSGDEKFFPACLKALDAMRRFRVPRGAQVWEVHQEIPDIRAAALAVEAFQIGYRITGEARYLDDASYWAWTGVPFVYSWHVPYEDTMTGHLMSSRDRDKPQPASIPFDECFQNPNRRVTPYATIPVLGPTFYMFGWFGVPVQWCGLEWAYKVLDLLQDRPGPLLKAVADGVVASGLQQMFDRSPWVGLYPDSWDLQINRAQGALLSAWLPLQCLQSQGRIPIWTRTWTRVVRSSSFPPLPRGDAGGSEPRQPAPPESPLGGSSGVRWHISGWGPVPDLKPPLTHPLRWSVSLRYPAGQLNELLIARAQKPQRISVEGEPLDELDAAPSALVAGWYYDATRRLVVVRFRQPADQAMIRASW